MNPYVERLYNGLVKENPTVILMLGMCPTLAVTTSVSNGVGMGISTLAVLVVSNLVISLCRKIIPDEVRLPAYIVIAASLVTVVDLFMHAYTPGIYKSLGIYIPLIVVNCIILGRAEAYASKAEPLMAAADGLGMGLGFTVALIIISAVRQVLGSEQFLGIGVFVKAPGAFLVIGFLVAIMNALQIKTAANKKVESCDGCCAACASASSCTKEEKEAK